VSNASREGRNAKKSLDLLKDLSMASMVVLHLYYAGIARIALFTKKVEEEYARLSAEGVEWFPNR
jgi:hypothetical protein